MPAKWIVKGICLDKPLSVFANKITDNRIHTDSAIWLKRYRFVTIYLPRRGGVIRRWPYRPYSLASAMMFRVSACSSAR